MSPGGHLAFTAAACAGAAVLTGSPAVTAAIAVGGFGIDVDHVVDYLIFERRRDLRPDAFLRYYMSGRVQRAVLVLHSYELFALLGLLAWWTNALVLWGYLWGALMHLALDICFNGAYTPRSISAFYSFGYRWAYRFRMQALLPSDELEVPRNFWAAFFKGAAPSGSRRERPLPAGRARPTSDPA